MFSHGHVRQLQAVSREFLVQLARPTPLLPGAGAVTFIDVDSPLRRMYGKNRMSSIECSFASTSCWPSATRTNLRAGGFWQSMSATSPDRQDGRRRAVVPQRRNVRCVVPLSAVAAVTW